MSIQAFFQAMRLNSNNKSVTLQVTYGELSAYDPTTHTGKFLLPLHLDDNDEPIETGFLQIGTPFNGPGYGAQFPPASGAQALIHFLDADGIYPVSAVFTFNDIEAVPFPDGKTWGHKDPLGSSVTTTVDGATEGDGVGAARIFGKAYSATSTTSGHSFTQDDIAQQVKMASAAGFHTLYDDAGRVLSHVTPGGLIHHMGDLTNEISTIAPHVGIGDLVANLPADAAALNQSHLTSFENNMFTKRLDDLTKFATAMIAAGVPNAGAVLAQLATLLHIPVPDGSIVAKIKS